MVETVETIENERFMEEREGAERGCLFFSCVSFLLRLTVEACDEVKDVVAEANDDEGSQACGRSCNSRVNSDTLKRQYGLCAIAGQVDSRTRRPHVEAVPSRPQQ